MGFYKSIAEVYNKIFPLNPGQVAFTNRTFTQTGDISLLDNDELLITREFNKMVDGIVKLTAKKKEIEVKVK